MQTFRGGAVIAIASFLSVAAAATASANTQVFAFSGDEQTYTVPAGVHSIHVVAIGARGGIGSSAELGGTAGGLSGWGDAVEADLAVSPRQVLFIEVGGPGGDGAGPGPVNPDVDHGDGGFNGGGDADPPASGERPGGGGGGATDIRTCSRHTPSCPGGGTTLQSRLLVAGGGGGGGSFGGGSELAGRGGDAGEGGKGTHEPMCTNATGNGAGGSAGTQTSGGAGGVGFPRGNSGALGLGGVAGTPTAGVFARPGGGGGGGYFGGGAGGSGCSGGGGGGGSSFAGSSASDVSMEPDPTDPSSVTITTGFAFPEPPSITQKPSNAFHFGKLTRKKRKGTARLAVILPGPGTLSLQGKGLVPMRQSVAESGTVELEIKAKGRFAHQLIVQRKLKLKAGVTFVPTGGEPATKSRAIKLLRQSGR